MPPEVALSSAAQGDGSRVAARPFFIAFEFPRLPTEIQYDGHPDGFWDFPERAGWILDGQRKYRKFHRELEKELGPIFIRLDSKYQCRRRVVPETTVAARPPDALSMKCFKMSGARTALSDKVSFLQTWLFFGVIHELSSITGVPIPDFQAGTAPDMLSTAPLEALIYSWKGAIDALDNHDQRCEKWRQILEVVQHVMSLQTCISTVRSQAKERRCLAYDECKVLLAIRVLFRAVLLTLALSSGPEALSDLNLLMEPTLTQSFPANTDELKDYATEEMLTLGWCKSECILLERFDGIYNFFATRLTTGRWKMDHSKCRKDLCSADHVDEETYETVHVQEGCKCDWVYAKSDDLCSLLDSGRVPLIKISKDGKLAVGYNQPYVAISHVWAHGLGNPHENALPRCQIDRLANYISNFQVAINQHDIAIWMDTLCVPVHRDQMLYRKKAMKLMGRTYQDAVAVLVLDREIQLLDTRSVSLFEQELITAFVGWTRRLWTLQEAALARALYVQASEAPHKLETVASDHDNLIAQICFRQNIAQLMRRRIPPMAILKQSIFEKIPTTPGFDIPTTTAALQKLVHAIKHRSTSKMEDEACILAITLGLDLQQIVDAPDVDRAMASFLLLLKDVPADIIFGNWPKLSREPFRWAPRSLLGLPLKAIQSFGPVATCDSRGLHVKYPGLVITNGSREISRVFFVIDEASGMKFKFQIREGDLETSLPETCALIFQRSTNETAIARVLHIGMVENGVNVIEVTVVGFLVLVATGGGLDNTTQRLLHGTLTPEDQCWRIT